MQARPVYPAFIVGYTGLNGSIFMLEVVNGLVLGLLNGLWQFITENIQAALDAADAMEGQPRDLRDGRRRLQCAAADVQ